MFIARATTTQAHNHLRSLRRLRSSFHSRESLSLSHFYCAQIHFHRIVTILMVASWRRILHKQFYERERASCGSSKWQRTTQSTNFPFRYIWRAKANYIKSNSLISVIHWKIIFVDIPLPLLLSLRTQSDSNAFRWILVVWAAHKWVESRDWCVSWNGEINLKIFILHSKVISVDAKMTSDFGFDTDRLECLSFNFVWDARLMDVLHTTTNCSLTECTAPQRMHRFQFRGNQISIP